jgi:hypothetical protein
MLPRDQHQLVRERAARSRHLRHQIPDASLVVLEDPEQEGRL